MKKTIAILLVLVIGMFGIFAGEGDPTPNIYDDATGTTLKITTSVGAKDAMHILADDTIPTSDDDGVWDQAATSVYSTNAKVVELTSDRQNIGYLNIQTNRSNGVKVTITATLLTQEAGDSTIGYTVFNKASGDEFSYVAGAAESDAILSIAASASGEGENSSTYGLRDNQTGLWVELENASSKAEGAYNATISFAYKAP